MLTPAGDVKVMDFGIARAMADASSTMTQTQAVIGTAQYLSPEQARGEPVDTRSDLYSAGCLLFELLTGRPPFVGDSPVAVAYQHVREKPQPPSTLDPGIPRSVDRIVLHALAKDREDRYQTAAEFRADVEAGPGRPPGRRRGRRSPAATAADRTATQYRGRRPGCIGRRDGHGRRRRCSAPAPGRSRPDDAVRRPLRAPTAGRRHASRAAAGASSDTCCWRWRSSSSLVAGRVPGLAALTRRRRRQPQHGRGARRRRPDRRRMATRAARRGRASNVRTEPRKRRATDETGKVDRPGPGRAQDRGADPSTAVTVRRCRTGPDLVEVPDLDGLTQEDAIQTRWTEVGLRDGQVTDEGRPGGRDRHGDQQRPGRRRAVEPGTAVNLVIASGDGRGPGRDAATTDEARRPSCDNLGLKVTDDDRGDRRRRARHW